MGGNAQAISRLSRPPSADAPGPATRVFEPRDLEGWKCWAGSADNLSLTPQLGFAIVGLCMSLDRTTGRRIHGKECDGL